MKLFANSYFPLNSTCFTDSINALYYCMFTTVSMMKKYPNIMLHIIQESLLTFRFTFIETNTFD